MQMYKIPPESPKLCQANRGSGKVTKKATANYKQKIKLFVDLSLKEKMQQTNNIAVYFKTFAALLLIANTTLSTLKWEDPEQNSIKKSR